MPTRVRSLLPTAWTHRTPASYRALMRYSHDRDPSGPMQGSLYSMLRDPNVAALNCRRIRSMLACERGTRRPKANGFATGCAYWTLVTTNFVAGTSANHPHTPLLFCAGGRLTVGDRPSLTEFDPKRSFKLPCLQGCQGDKRTLRRPLSMRVTAKRIRHRLQTAWTSTD
jgi:hypothetical protein